ncbi:MAG: hypothetical protein V4714_22870 [Bacteroidota bacterium]
MKAVTVLNARGETTDSPLFQTKQLIASYLHLYWGEKPEIIEALLTL